MPKAGCLYCQHYRANATLDSKYGLALRPSCAIGHTTTAIQWLTVYYGAHPDDIQVPDCYTPNHFVAVFDRLESSIDELTTILTHYEIE